MSPSSLDVAGSVPNGSTDGTSSKVGSSSPSEPIAIVGMSCKFGGDASSPSKLWDLIAAGRDGWSPIPHDRFDAKSLYHPDQQRIDRYHAKGGYFLGEDITLFDAAFFNHSADAASAMDPQLRLLMESVYEAIENAGMPLEKLSGSNTSVFTASFSRDNADRLMKDPEAIPTSFLTGNGTAMFSNRISHFYDLKGPSITIDTACSGSMAALHLGARSIQWGESDISIIGASSTILNPDFYIALSNLGVLSPDGKCYSWDHRANGYGRGEGVAILILKHLSAAIQDGDFVHAVIRQSAMNQDGKTGTITSPSMEAQQKLIEECYQHAGLDFSKTGYVEAHMTGTSTGDPIEAEAIAKTLGKSRSPGDAVYVGSIKPNIGHTEAVSGLASIIKTALVLQNKLIPPNINYERTNPKIPLSEWNLQVPISLTPWPQGMPLRASVSSFGYGGTNVHVIMEASPNIIPRKVNVTRNSTNSANSTNGIKGGQALPPSVSSSYVYIVSSKDPAGAFAMNKRLAAYIKNSISNGHEPLPADLAHSLAERRSRFPWATAVRAENLTELAAQLEEPHRNATRAMSSSPRIGFVFSGQGAQWHAMGRELISTYPVFGSAIRQGDQVLKKDYGAAWSLYDELLHDEKSSRVHDIDLSQPISVAIQLCLVDLLKSWNITPSAVVSHSSGEIAAAYATGMLSFKEALGVVYYRGQLALKYQKLTSLSGGMLAARLSVEEADEYLKDISGGEVVVACINSPISVTLSGDLLGLEEVASRLEQDGVFSRRLKVPLAYHSHHMQHMAREYGDNLRAILPTTNRGTRTLFASPVTGDIVTSPEALGPEHWVRNLTSPVLFSKALEKMVFSPKTSDRSSCAFTQATNVDILLEIGAHNTLSGPIRQILGEMDLPYMSCLIRSINSVNTMQDVACGLLIRGYPVSLKEVNSLLGHEPRYVHNLPSYAWNHSSRYAIEPRASREHRYKRFAPNELLGTPIAGANKLTPTWRNFLRVQDIPWLTDHQLESKVALPGAGYVSMAIEAVRLHTYPFTAQDSFLGYRLRDVVIMNALIIPSSSAGIETMFSLRACSEKELDYKDWYEFELYSVGADDSWIQHCKGYILAETNTSKSKLKAEFPAPRAETFLATKTKVRYVEPDSTFSTLRKMDIYHGPTFQNLISSHVATDRAITKFTISHIALKSNDDYVLHPTTLDSIFQSCYVCLPSEVKEGAMLVPRSIGSMSVPRRLGRHTGHQLQAFVDLLKWNRREAAFNASVFPDGDGVECALPFQLHNFCFQRIRQAEDDTPSKVSQIHAKSRWELDILHDIPTTIKESMKIWLNDAEVSFEKRLREASYHLIFDAATQLGNPNTEGWQWYHKRFYNWMKTVLELGETGELAPGSENWSKTSKGSKQSLFDSLTAENAAGKLTCRIGQQLANIIRGDITPLELMMEGRLLYQFYQEVPRLKDRSLKHLRQIMELYAVKQPGAKVLEIGGGTGGATTDVLEAFAARAKGRPGSLLGHYDFTDISSGFFPAAKERFAAWEGMMSYTKLDIEIDPIQQGFTTSSYDLILAAQVLHATKSLERTLSHVRKLLKPGGKLVLLEGTRKVLDEQLIFGTLPGWWLSEEPERKMGPNVNVKAWDKLLRATGFTGVDFEVGDCEQPEFQSMSTIVTTAESQPSYPSTVSIVCDQNTPRAWLDALAKAIQAKTGSSLTFESFEYIQAKDDRVYIVALDMGTPFVDAMDRTAFQKLKSLLLNSLGIFWLSCGGMIDAKEPLWAQTQGLLRTLRREDFNKRCVQLDFESTSDPWSMDTINHIVHVFQEGFNYNISHSSIEWEYAVKDSILHVPRVYPDVKQDRAYGKTNPTPELKPFHEPGRHLIWEIAEDGLLDNLYFAEQPETVDHVPSGMVEIESKAFGLNFQDVMTAMGLLKPTAFVGHEGSGIIKRLGPDTEQSGLQIGDRVCGVFNGRFASTSQAFWTSVTKILDEMSWEEAASIPYAYSTAYIGLYDIARLGRDERVLIHSATGDVGQAALMLAQHIGAEVFVTCGTERNRDLLIDQYNVPPSHIFSSRDTSFAAAIMTKTRGQGVDVVLNSLAGSLLKATWGCMARFGRFVEIGKVDIEAARHLDMAPFGRCVTMAGIDLIQYSKYKGQVLKNALADSVRLYNIRRTKLVYPIASFSMSDMEKAMRQMQTGMHMGKLILIPRPGDRVKVISRAPSLNLDNADSTYLISGGLGRIGHPIVLWLIEKGAKNLLVISRKAASHPKASSLLQKAKAHGCNLYVRNCNVSDSESVLELLADSTSILPPVRGVIQAAMVLDDTVLERMTHEQWLRAIRPKVSGTMNLHNHLPNLSFFIMLSSVSGILGNVSQANYAAGNTFQDALAQHRTANGLPAVTIDLGLVANDRHEDGLRRRVEKTISSTILPIDHVLRLIEGAIRDPLRKHPNDSQIITCIARHEDLPEDQAAKNDKRFGTLRLGNSSAVVLKDTPRAMDQIEDLMLKLTTTSIADSKAVGLVSALLVAKVGEIFNIAASDIDASLSLPHHGVDSLVAVQFRNWLGSVMKARVSIFEILQAPSLTDFAALVVARCSFIGKTS